MPEIKHTFAGGKMNKDIDERLVPNGEYRHAMNIQVRTTGGDGNAGVGDSGAVQNIQGNKAILSSVHHETPYSSNTPGNVPTVVGSVAHEKSNKGYFFVAGTKPGPIVQAGGFNSDIKLFIDTIVEVDTGTGIEDPTIEPVFVDKYAILAKTSDHLNIDQQVIPSVDGVNTSEVQVSAELASHLRRGMVVRGFGNNFSDPNTTTGAFNELLTRNEIHEITDDNIVKFKDPLFINLAPGIDPTNAPPGNWLQITALIFEAPRVLNFDNEKKISAINVLDDLLIWTDGKTEPKRINIQASKDSTSTYTRHTTDTDAIAEELQLSIANSEADGDSFGIEEASATIIKSPPRKAPILELSTSTRSGTVTVGGIEQDFAGLDPTFGPGSSVSFTNSALSGAVDSPINWTNNDVLIFTEEIVDVENRGIIRATIDNFNPENGQIFLTIISINNEYTPQSATVTGSGIWTIELDDRDPLFELKLGRFGLRYKYDNGEYSSFGPWSQLAFLPGKYDYNHKRGYNLGMVNTVRSLKIKGFIPEYEIMPPNLEAVEILWKTTESPNVYIVKTISKGKDPEWDDFTVTPQNYNTGQLVITSEMIHRVVEKNQLLRAWDNVPRYAKSQEIAANRIIYGNYTQGYSLSKALGLNQNLKSYNDATESNPKGSVKSMRNYKWGVVFGDKYGRETPVITGGYLEGESENNFEMQSGDVSVSKQFASMRNLFEIKQIWNYGMPSGIPDEWIEYVKYYVKETSNEYYNLIMDRWYEAEDGNLWLSFASADRNKIDEETYLNLKTKHGSSEPVTVDARYKVLAIENEPPDFIRVDPRIMGKVKVGPTLYLDPTADGNAGVGSIFSENGFNTVDNAPDNLASETSLKLEQFGNFLKDYDSKGDLQIRVAAQNGNGDWKYGSNWQTLTYYTTLDENGTQAVIRWRKPFGGAGSDMRQYFQADEGITGELGFDGAISGLTYHIEFREMVVVTTAAEFEGKFFVKIERDDILETQVMNFTSSSTTYEIDQAYNLGYVDSVNENPAVSVIVEGQELHPRYQYQWLNTTGADNSTGIAATTSSDNFLQTLGNSLNFANENANQENISDTTLLADGWDNGNGVFASANLTPQDAGAFLGLGCDGSSNPSNDNPAWVEGGGLGGNDLVNWARYTKEFWKWQSMIEGGPSGQAKYLMFLDSARAKHVKMIGPSQPLDINGNQTGYYNVDGDANRPYYYYKPTGLDKGYQSSLNFSETIENQFGRMVISINKFGGLSVGESWLHSTQSNFKAWFTQPGNKFRFGGDPNQKIYQIVGDWEYMEAKNYSPVDDGALEAPATSTQTDYDDLLDYQYSDTPTLENIIIGGGEISTAGDNCSSEGDACSASDEFCQREGIRFEFRLFDQSTGQLANGGTRGIDPFEWDPRGTVCHDGREAFSIQTLKPVTPLGDYVPPVGNAACWETEPKEDVGLDLYYEASSAIPMTLNEKNAKNFIPYHAEVSLKQGINGSGSNGDWGVGLVKNHRVSYIGYGGTPDNAKIFVGIEAQSTVTNNWFPYTSTDSNINALTYNSNSTNNLNTYFVFEHLDGTKTMARVVRKVVPIDYDGNIIQPTVLANVVIDGDTYAAYYDGINNCKNCKVRFTETPDGYTSQSGFWEIDVDVWRNTIEIPWYNCYSFGNGVESDRIRDDYNAPTIDNGVKVSTTFLEFGEEAKESGLIYSGIYNSISGVNNLNEFNQAEKITKDLNPLHGSIQALKTRDTDLVVFTEDKILKVITNKDALFNADGNAQLTATNRVLGTAIPFAGDYGISNNPESLAFDQFRMYFTDMQRGAVLRLSGDGLTPISNVGMKTWFRNNLKKTKHLIGSFDTVNGEYNLTLNYKSSYGTALGSDTTISFNESSKGWVSFKSFVPQSAISVGGKYITAKQSKPVIPVDVNSSQTSFTLWEHYKDIVDGNTSSLTFGKVINRNVFYAPTGIVTAVPEVPEINNYFTSSSIDVMFNDIPSKIKSFRTLMYEGSQGKVIPFVEETVYDSNGNLVSNYTNTLGQQVLTDGEYYNLDEKKGWWVSNIVTDQSHDGTINEFKEKEGKWYNRIGGKNYTEDIGNHLNEFNVQGIGTIGAIPDNTGTTVTETEEFSGDEDCIQTQTETSTVDNGDGTSTTTTTIYTFNECTGDFSETSTTSTETNPVVQNLLGLSPSGESIGYDPNVTGTFVVDDSDGDGIDDNVG